MTLKIILYIFNIPKYGFNTFYYLTSLSHLKPDEPLKEVGGDFYLTPLF